MQNEILGEEYRKKCTSTVDTVPELFRYISELRLPCGEEKRAGEPDSAFGQRVEDHAQLLKSASEYIRKEMATIHQKEATATVATANQLQLNPPVLPVPTQHCMEIGWEVALKLLELSDVAETQISAIKVLRGRFKNTKPMGYADGIQLAEPASIALNKLCAFLVKTLQNGAVHAELSKECSELLLDLAICRGSLPYLLTSLRHMMMKSDTVTFNTSELVIKLKNVKERPLFGIADASGELYACGQNSYGELALGDDIERRQLTRIPLAGWDVKHVVSGNESLAVLSMNGMLLTCGLNKSGQCGQGHYEERVMMLRPVPSLLEHKVKHIAAANGCEHMIAILESGLAYSWGYNDRGQLGHDSTATKIHTPKVIEALRNKQCVAAAVSYHHSAIITDNGELYTCGMNDTGQLGLDNLQHQAAPCRVEALEGHEIVEAACGLYHTIVCSSKGAIFSFGKNDYGQLGLGHNRPSKFPAAINIPNERIVSLSCGYYHTLAISNSGKLFTFGRNDYGQLGLGHKIHQNLPQVVSFPAETKLVRVVSGCYHNVVLSDQGKAFAYGRNNKGQLGSRSVNDSLVPTLIRLRSDEQGRAILNISAGFYTSTVIAERQQRKSSEFGSTLQKACSVTTLCGRVDIDSSGEIEGLSNFGTVCGVGIALSSGVWFYEVTLVTSGLIQIGWVDGYFQASSDQGEGVGDHSHSWSYDGNRQRRWNSGSSAYGDRWKTGDVIGCILDFNQNHMRFYRNGVDLGVAYSDLQVSSTHPLSSLVPAISLERGEIIVINLGSKPFSFPPANLNFEAINESISNYRPQIELERCTKKPQKLPTKGLVGAATVMVNGDIFVVGGGTTSSSGGSSDVWVCRKSSAKWEKWSSLPENVIHHQVVHIMPDQLYVIGGQESDGGTRHMKIWKCSISSTSTSLPNWEIVQDIVGASGDLPVGRAFHTATVLNVRLDPVIFVFGGKSSSDTLLGDAWVYSIGDHSWSQLPSSPGLEPGQRLGCTACAAGEYVYVFGGLDQRGTYRADLWRYNTFDRMWQICHDDGIQFEGSAHKRELPEQLDKIPQRRAHYAAAVDYGVLYIGGGITEDSRMLDDLWCYSFVERVWCKLAVNHVNGRLSQYSHAAFLYDTGSINLFESTPLHSVQMFGGFYRDSSGRKLICTSIQTVARVSISSQSSLHDDTSCVSAGNFLEEAATSGEATYNTKFPVVSIFSQIERLVGGDISLDEPDKILASPCAYRRMCLDPVKQTFQSFLDTINYISQAFIGPESTGLDKWNAHIFLVLLKLLKLNLFEVSALCF